MAGQAGGDYSYQTNLTLAMLAQCHVHTIAFTQYLLLPRKDSRRGERGMHDPAQAVLWARDTREGIAEISTNRGGHVGQKQAVESEMTRPIP